MRKWYYPTAPRYNRYKQWRIANQVLHWGGYGSDSGKALLRPGNFSYKKPGKAKGKMAVIHISIVAY